MKKKTLTFIAAFMLTLAWAVAAQALPSQTYVASTGNNANDCTQSTPCRTFAGAVPKTAVKGVITALDSSTYGIVTIDKALTIQAAPGVSAVIEGGGTTDAVTINAAATDIVALRNLHIFTRSKAATKGIVINTVGTLHVENCVITGFGEAGILGPNVCNESGCAQLYVIDTILRDNVAGMKIGSVKASIEHCRIEHNHTGILVQAQGEAMIRDSVLVDNSDVGLKAETFGSAKMENCVVKDSATGILGDSININGQTFFSSIYVSTTMVIANGTGLSNNGGLLISFGNNRIGDNGVNGAFTATIPEK
jgi:nitrous oxidase accessory protein NosD